MIIDLNDRRLIEMSVRILAFCRRSFGKCVEDVAFWIGGKGYVRFAIRGNPWLLYRCLISRTPIYQRAFSLELVAAAALGVKQRTNSGWPSPQFSSGGSMCLAEFFEMMDLIISSALSASGIDAEASLTVMPYPGVPMTLSAEPIPYFSVRERGVVRKASAPRWVGPPVSVNIDGRGYRERMSVNLCLIARNAKPLDGAASLYAVSGSGSARGTVIMAAHSTNDALLSEQAEKGIESCGGFLYPSISVGSVPASNFGPISIIFDPRLILKDLSPFRKTRSRDVPPDTILYLTDSWTPDTNEILGNYSAKAFIELSGNEDFSSYYRPEGTLYALGPIGFASAPISGEVVRIDSTKKMIDAVRRRMNIWKDQSYEDFVATRSKASNEHHYGYLEAKAISVIPISWASAVVAPDYQCDRIASYLSQFGFSGASIPLRLSPDEERVFSDNNNRQADHDDWIRLRYSWRVSRAVVEVGDRYGSAFSL